MAVFAPIPSVSAATAVRVNPGLLRNIRIECFTSRKKVSSTERFLSLLSIRHPPEKLGDLAANAREHHRWRLMSLGIVG
jgi:hypothetical protein